SCGGPESRDPPTDAPPPASVRAAVQALVLRGRRTAHGRSPAPDPSRSPPSRDSMPFRHSGAPAPPGPPCGTADRGALPADTRSPAEPPPPSCSAPLLPPARIQPPARTPSHSSLSAPFPPTLLRTPNLEGAAS